jgi:ATP-dependent metalloprotease FtsH
MDDNVSRRKKSGSSRRYYTLVQRYGRQVWRTFIIKKSFLLTIFLSGVCGILLCTLLSQLPPLPNNIVPTGESEIAYSTFLAQIKAGNVQAVALQDSTLNGLLAQPLTGKSTTAQQGQKTSPDPVAWLSAQRTGGSSTGAITTTNAGSARTIFVRIPAGMNGLLTQSLVEHHILFTTIPDAHALPWLTALWKMLPFLLLVGLLLFLMVRRSPLSSGSIDDRVTQLGKSRVRRFTRVKERADHTSTTTLETEKGKPGEKNGVATGDVAQTVSTATTRVVTIPDVTFDDVAGIDDVRAELVEIVEFLRTPDRYNRLGAHIPRGALLVGPPGTGKTLLAKAVAGEAGVPFFSMSASEFVEMFVGVGASRVRDLFNQAREAAPCVVFIDEIDAVGRKRSARATSSDERDQTLNQLLIELDGFDTRQTVVVLAATNRADILDTALLRPGRFDRQVVVSPPDRAGREAILKVHTREVPLDEEVNLARLARMTPGMTGADLANLVNEAALTAARRDLDQVTMPCFETALARVQLGALRPLVMSEEEKRVIAVHEGGHALVAYHLPEADTVNCVTILPRGQSLGVTQFVSETDRYNYNREMLMTRIAVALGGRVAEEFVFGPQRVTTGAENDLQVVTNLARRMVTRWGMSERVGVIFADHSPDTNYSAKAALDRFDPNNLSTQSQSLILRPGGKIGRNSSQQPPRPSRALTTSHPTFSSGKNGVTLSALIDAEIRQITLEGYTKAREILVARADQLTLLTEALMEHEQLSRVEFEELLRSPGEPL